MDIYELEEKLRKPRKRRAKVKVVGKSVFKLRKTILGRSNYESRIKNHGKYSHNS